MRNIKIGQKFRFKTQDKFYAEENNKIVTVQGLEGNPWAGLIWVYTEDNSNLAVRREELQSLNYLKRGNK